jgi:hypothetical protein
VLSAPHGAPQPAPTPVPFPAPTEQPRPIAVFPDALDCPPVVVQPGPVAQQPTPVISANPLPTPGVRGPVVLTARPGYTGPANGYVNNIPDDLQKGKSYKTLKDVMANPEVRMLIGEGGIIYAAKYIYVITKDGEIRLGSYRTHHHPDLVDGENVYGAGQIFFDAQGNITGIDDHSGHYFPRDGSIFGSGFFDYMQYLLNQKGVNVSKDIFDTY